MSLFPSSKDGSSDGDVSHISTTSPCAGGDCCSEQQRQDEGTCHTGIIEKPLDSHHVTGHESNRPIRAAHRSGTLRKYVLDDVEEGSAYTEHVILKFQGSNCPGCTSKISKAFESLPAVHNLQMNTILLQAEFDLDLAKSSVRDVIDSVKSASGRACQRTGDGWQELDVVVSGICGAFGADAMLPVGVKDVTQVNRHTFSIKYDAEIIGARQLLKALNTDLDGPVSLALPKSHDEVPTEIRATAFTTALSWIFTIPILVLAWAPLPKHVIAYGAVCLALATVVQVVVAGPFYPRALRSLIVNRVVDLDLLVVLSTSITYGFSVASFICEVKGTRLVSGIYFETSALLITFIMMGRLMSDFACHRAFRIGSIKSLQTRSALLVDISDSSIDKELDVDVRLLQLGDTFRVKPSCPVATDAGSSVIAGSVNLGDAVLVRVTRLPGSNTIDEIAGMVEEVTHSKTKAQHTADEVARWIVPASATLAMLTLVVWFAVGITIQEESAGSAILKAIPYAISVLVVCCPCAVAFAVPMVLVIASGVGAKHGVVFRSAEVMRAARGVTHVVFDKTGTLTQGCLSVVSDEYCSETQNLGAAIVVALTNQSDHPVSLAVSKHLKAAGVEPATVTHVTPVVGKGIEGTYDGRIVRIGNARWLGVEDQLPVRSLLSQNLTVLCATQGDRLVAVFGLEATLREEASTVVASLVERGIAVSIISGDEIGAVQKVALKLGISHEVIRAKCTPREKQQYVKELMQADNNTVLFCGDGVNDAAALSQASVGVHMKSGPGTAWIAGDAVLIRPSLLGILVLIDLSRDSCRQMVFNFTWAAVYNVVAILFAAGAFIHIRLSPQYAGLGEAVSVLPVILVPLQLRWRKYL
ncbi:hypothetical protein HO173_012213 [Letharia columbiana]|uniref:PCA1 HMA heavy metal-associated domain-containing protein n=1 Tax=Letharia columbiana TaxID=112416 RepID=A0A8H6CQD7_9LECA|nr:uncharacterized protein HO173_012213 [Letharia columbiana]KAF6227574.1 hypothetical protein HO173_012213 [Letharia columbiana]